MFLFSYRLKTLLPVLEFLFDPNIVVKHFSCPKLWESRGEHLYSFIGYIAIYIYMVCRQFPARLFSDGRKYASRILVGRKYAYYIHALIELLYVLEVLPHFFW